MLITTTLAVDLNKILFPAAPIGLDVFRPTTTFTLHFSISVSIDHTDYIDLPDLIAIDLVDPAD